MAADDKFEITIASRGAHAAMPHLGDDPIVAAAAMIGAIQTIVSRTANPQEEVVVSITQMHGQYLEHRPRGGRAARHLPIFQAGDPQGARGRPAADFRKASHPRMRQNLLLLLQADPAAVNAEGPTEQATRAAVMVAGDANVQRDVTPSMGCEDFGFMLAARPGCYLWIRQRPIVDGVGLHSSRYDFNDEILPLGASYWAKLVESVLPRSEA